MRFDFSLITYRNMALAPCWRGRTTRYWLFRPLCFDCQMEDLRAEKIILHGLCNYLDKLQSLCARPDGSLQGMSRKVQEELRQAARP